MTKKEFLEKIKDFPDEAELKVIRAAGTQSFAVKASSGKLTSECLELTGEAIYLIDRNTIFLRGW